jgi:hypothetical protein
MKISLGALVYLKADDCQQPHMMIVERFIISCDGTSHDGAGLYCRWYEGNMVFRGWISESSVKVLNGE